MCKNVDSEKTFPALNCAWSCRCIFHSHSPVNMPDRIRKRFGYGQLWPLRPACCQNRAGSYMPDQTSRIRLGSVLPKKPGSYCANRPGSDQIWMAWSGFGQTDLVRKQADVQESSGPVSGRTQPARHQSPTFRLGSSTAGPDYIVQNQPGSDFIMADCVRFWPNESGPEESRYVCNNCRAHFWPTLPSRAKSDPACLLGHSSTQQLQEICGSLPFSCCWKFVTVFHSAAAGNLIVSLPFSCCRKFFTVFHSPAAGNLWHSSIQPLQEICGCLAFSHCRKFVTGKLFRLDCSIRIFQGSHAVHEVSE